MEEVRPQPPFVVRASEVSPYVTAGSEGVFESRLIIGPDGAGSSALLVNHFTVLAGRGLEPHAHPDSDELYYVLGGEGYVELARPGEAPRRHDIAAGTAVFIPAGVTHHIVNTGDSAITMLTIWPSLPKPGSNPVYDGRIAAWGTTFRRESPA